MNTAEAKIRDFERLMLPHLNAAHNLARWLMKSDTDAQDAVQESYLRAFRFFDGFHGEDGRAWLLAIVRNTCRSSLQHRQTTAADEFDEAQHSPSLAMSTPEQAAMRAAGISSVQTCIEALPAEYREVVIMRELEDCSYKEIAAAIGAPIGTVMSRLARARARLQKCLAARARKAGV